jgi:hypothetical protein
VRAVLALLLERHAPGSILSERRPRSPADLGCPCLRGHVSTPFRPPRL